MSLMRYLEASYNLGKNSWMCTKMRICHDGFPPWNKNSIKPNFFDYWFFFSRSVRFYIESNWAGLSEAKIVLEAYAFHVTLFFYNLDSKSAIHSGQAKHLWHNQAPNTVTHLRLWTSTTSWLTQFQAVEVYLVRRHCWVGDHHALHRSSLLVVDQVLTLWRLLHSH